MLASLLINNNNINLRGAPGPDGKPEDRRWSDEQYRTLQLGIWRRKQVRLALQRIREQAPKPLIDKTYQIAQYSIKGLSEPSPRWSQIELEVEAIMADLVRLQELQQIYRQWRDEEDFIVLLMMV